MSKVSPEAAIAQKLKTEATLTAIRKGRIYNGVAPLKATYPLQIYNRPTRRHVRHMGGHSGIAIADIQIDTYSNSKVQSDELAHLTMVYLEGLDEFTETVNGNTITILEITILDDDAPSEFEGDGSDRSLDRNRQNYQVVHKVATS